MSKEKKCKIVVGNGFDLYCGLESTLNMYLKNENKSKKCEEIVNYIDYLMKLIRNDITGNINLDSDDIGLLIRDINIWDFILYIFGREKNNWNQFEEILKSVITSNSFIYINNDKNEFEHFIEGKHYNVASYSDNILNTRYPIGYRKIGIFTALYNRYNKDYSNDYFKELLSFEKRFGAYVNSQFESKYNEYHDKAKSFFQIVSKRYNISSIDTFNYTPLEKIADFCKVHHVNGAYIDSQPIFGFDYNASMTNDYKKYTKTYRRMFSNLFNENNTSYSLSSEFDDLVVFGHSLCESDYNYFFPIFDYMHILEANYDNKIVIYYHNDELNGEIIDRRTTVVNSFIKMIEKYSEDRQGKVNSRIIDSLSIQGRIKFIGI